ncbi:MADS-box transcription factor [Parasponia andersonii]|uniref:MADS-box transcription factor n=1 Tax=Parasponia andersonii TaxID=3476 RepID=A0A2P5CXI8_PARAD|nr:MADS-box transcription factor [Parasponia andersonii]
METSRKVYEGRKATLKKKAGELVTRCNSEVCLVCYDPYGQVDVWPEDPAKAHSVIRKYYSSLQQEVEEEDGGGGGGGGGPSPSPSSSSSTPPPPSHHHHHHHHHHTKKRKREKLNLSDMLERKRKKLQEQVDNQFLEEDNVGNKNNDIMGFSFLPVWYDELDNLSKNSLMGLSDYLNARIRSLDERISRTQFQKQRYDQEVQPPQPSHVGRSYVMADGGVLQFSLNLPQQSTISWTK